jgi:hypothetical protein
MLQSSNRGVTSLRRKAVFQIVRVALMRGAKSGSDFLTTILRIALLVRATLTAATNLFRVKFVLRRLAMGDPANSMAPIQETPGFPWFA